MYINDSVQVKKHLGYWEELLQEWVFMVHRVYRISKELSSVHSEKERSNTGLLAAAAIRNGWVALEESRTEKQDKISKKETYNGRCDLVLWRDQRHHEIEAKFVRISVRAKSNGKINKAFKKALFDSSRSTSSGYRSERKIAITYIVPTIKPDFLNKTNDEEIAELIEKLISEIKNDHSPSLLSYAFPGPVELEGSKSLGLGVILVGEITA